MYLSIKDPDNALTNELEQGITEMTTPNYISNHENIDHTNNQKVNSEFTIEKMAAFCKRPQI